MPMVRTRFASRGKHNFCLKRIGQDAKCALLYRAEGRTVGQHAAARQ
jgi:hypothetical protein